ncbi:7 transmembrane receptor (rhodopsin) [Mactra antiquata]
MAMEINITKNCENVTESSGNVSNFPVRCFNETSSSNGNWMPSEFEASAKNIVLSVVLTTIDVVTILGNLLVLVAFFVEKKLFHPFNMFIFNLAVTDFLVAITAMTFYTIDTLLGYWPFGYVMCGLWIYFDFAMTFASVFTLVAISIDRFWCVTWAVHYRRYNSKTKTAIILAVIWFCVFAIWTPPFIGDRLKHNEIYFCIWEPSDNREFVIFVAVVGHYIPCFIMVFCYIKVFITMRRQVILVENMNTTHMNVSNLQNTRHAVQTNSVNDLSNTHIGTVSSTVEQNNGGNRPHQMFRRINNSTNNSNTQSHDSGGPSTAGRTILRTNHSRERRIFITLTYVLLSYLICWFPFYIAFDTYAWKPNVVPGDLYTFFFWMTYVNSTLNPFIYAYTSKEFRGAFIKVLSSLCNCFT